MPRTSTKKGGSPKAPPTKKLEQQPRANFALPDNVYDHVKRALQEGNWGEDIQVLEFADYLLFPAEIHKRKLDGKFEVVKVRLRIPREHELRKARAKAREIMKEDGLDPELDKDLFVNIETWCILAHAIRDDTEPHSPFVPDPRHLETRYDKHSLMAIWARLDIFTRLVDPRPDELGKAEIIALIAAIAKEENTGPLAVYESRAQASCIVTMAKLCALFLASKSSSESREVLKEEPSAPST